MIIDRFFVDHDVGRPFSFQLLTLVNVSTDAAMEEWQRRMKAEKEAERQKKMESASTLHGYRGGVAEDDLKLKKEKDAERQKKMESAEMLKGYRGGVTEEDLKLKALREEERKKHQEAADSLHSYQAKEVKTIPKQRQSQGPQTAYPTPVNAGSDKNNDRLAGIDFGNVSERAAALTAAELNAQKHTTNATATTTQQSTGMPNGSLPTTEDAAATDNDANGEAVPPAPISTESPVWSQEPAMISDSPVLVEAPSDSATESPVMVPHARPVEDTAAAPATNESATANGHGATTAKTPSPARFDVLFSFGIVTVHKEPDLTSYMSAVQNVVSKALTENDTGITFEPSKRPFVKDRQWDSTYVSRSGRSDVRRMVVTAAVPVFAKDSSMRSVAKKTVVGALQAAIQSGDFLSLAQH